MTLNLQFDEKNPMRYRNELDTKLHVRDWQIPGGAYRQRVAVPRAPVWWRGDEDASQSFMHAMGMVSLE